MSVSDPVNLLRQEVRTAFSTSQGGHSKLEVTAHTINALLKTIDDQEREILKLERNHTEATEAFDTITAYIEYIDFSEAVPDEEGLYECFVGDSIEEGGRMFLYWDNTANEFYYQDDEGGQSSVDNVLYWRHALPNPDEELDLF